MDFNFYFSNPEIDQLLQDWQAAYPHLVQVSQIGQSHEARPIWLVTLTNAATGKPDEKPAVWVDANIHATEIAGTTAALYAVSHLLETYGTDPQVTRLLDGSVYYIVPRVNPDGAALAMADNPRYVRSGVRSYPWDEIDEGLHIQDINGDGQILQMRIADPQGDWKVSSLDPRLLQKRGIDEQGGVYYRLLAEGLLEDYDGYLIKLARPPEGLDFNRNFPFQWRSENEQHGAGPYPTSEPETRALADFIISHPNISFAITFHTFSRVLLRPYSTKPDSDMNESDLLVFKKLGERGTQISGYRNVSTFHDFTYNPKEITTGAFDDWMYDHRGAFTFTIELWDLPTASGIKDRKFIEWWREHPHEEDLQILKWVDENAPGGFVEWFPYQHPQLGQVELGGWNSMYTWRNPPPAFMEAEAALHYPFLLALGDMLPHLAVHTLDVQSLENGAYHINLVVENQGFLPTHTSEQSKARRVARPVRVELSLPEGASLVNGKRRTELGHLEGRSNKLWGNSIYETSPTDNRARLEWVVRTSPGATINLKIASERAGTLYQEIHLG